MYWHPPNGLNQKPHELKATKLKFLFIASAEQRCNVASGLPRGSWRCVEVYAFICQISVRMLLLMDTAAESTHPESSFSCVDFTALLMWHAASVHNNSDINTSTLTPELHCSHSHVVRRTVTQIPISTKKPFTLLHLQKEVRCWVQKSDEIGAEIMKE